MNRETDFQRNVKWVIYMTAGYALCQFISFILRIKLSVGPGDISKSILSCSRCSVSRFHLYIYSLMRKRTRRHMEVMR